MLPPASADREARLLVFAARTGRWKGIFAVHSWVVFKPRARTRLEPLRRGRLGQSGAQNGWAPDGRWFGDSAARARRRQGRRGRGADPAGCRRRSRTTATPMPATTACGPGRTATPSSRRCCAPCPSLRVTLPPNAIGKDFRDGAYAGLTDSRTGVEAILYGCSASRSAGSKASSSTCLGLVAGLDMRHPAVKLPGFGRLGHRRRAPRIAAPDARPRTSSVHNDVSDCPAR